MTDTKWALMLSLLITLFLVVMACRQLTIAYNVNKPEEIIVQGDSFTLEWDSDVADHYIYYRAHGTEEWDFLAIIFGYELLIDDTMLDYGIYDFAVTAIIDQVESEKHISLDIEAQPPTGWYLNWMPKAQVEIVSYIRVR